MALVVITICDEDDTIDVKLLSEPPVREGEETPAQRVAGVMLASVSDAVMPDSTEVG